MTNEAAIGYAIRVLRENWDFDAVDIRVFIGDMKGTMDEITEEEAEEAYKNS